MSMLPKLKEMLEGLQGDLWAKFGPPCTLVEVKKVSKIFDFGG